MIRIGKTIQIAFLALVGVWGVNASAQQTATLYFLENAPMRHYINPAFQPVSRFYLGVPILGYTGLWAGNNSLSVSDLVYNSPEGNAIWALHPDGDKDRLYGRLRAVTMVDADIRLNLFQMGWRYGESYWHIFADERINVRGGLPRDLFRFALYGMEDLNGVNSYNLKAAQLQGNIYTELGLGYSRSINEQWHIGAKLKALLGTAFVSSVQERMDLTLSPDEWNLNGNGQLNIAMPNGIVKYPEQIENIAQITATTPQINSVQDVLNLLKPSGVGGAIDLGVEYTPFEMLSVSASVVDLGLIKWKGKAYKYSIDGTYDGLGTIPYETIQNGSVMDTVNSRLQAIMSDALVDNGSANSFLRMISPKMNIAVEGRFWENRVGVGLVSQTGFINANAYEELTLGVSFRPSDWFNLAGSYSFVNGRWASVGAGLSLGASVVNLTLAADYVPFSYAQYQGVACVPYKVKGLNLAFGLNLVIPDKKVRDADHDGVQNKFDLCPNTPLLVPVDKDGCPLDSDGDGVVDYLDQCPNTPAEAYATVDEFGCPADTDGDGVPDYLDKCPDTPKEAYGMVDASGCPLDTDMDGVPDYLDECPETPRQAYGFVDEKGCLKDTDGDGVPDYLDRCNDTPVEAYATIDEYGCPKDTDGDGVPDYLDKCPDTPAEAKGMLDEYGCPKDTDGDSVPDYLDKCPTVPGTIENDGCPEIKKEVRSLFTKAMQGIQFETGKAVIKKSSYAILKQIAKVFIDNPTYQVEIQGHTDNVGNKDMNLQLSEKRANAVRDFLIKEGVDANRMTAVGYGDTCPVASNKTSKGRAQNRRVEFVVSFEQISYETVDMYGNPIQNSTTDSIQAVPADSVEVK